MPTTVAPTVASAMPSAVATTMGCTAATVAHTMSATVCCMYHAFSADMSRASRTVAHANPVPGVSTNETNTVSGNTSCASSADMSYAGRVVMSEATDSVG